MLFIVREEDQELAEKFFNELEKRGVQVENNGELTNGYSEIGKKFGWNICNWDKNLLTTCHKVFGSVEITELMYKNISLAETRLRYKPFTLDYEYTVFKLDNLKLLPDSILKTFIPQEDEVTKQIFSEFLEELNNDFTRENIDRIPDNFIKKFNVLDQSLESRIKSSNQFDQIPEEFKDVFVKDIKNNISNKQNKFIHLRYEEIINKITDNLYMNLDKDYQQLEKAPKQSIEELIKSLLISENISKNPDHTLIGDIKYSFYYKLSQIRKNYDESRLPKWIYKCDELYNHLNVEFCDKMYLSNLNIDNLNKKLGELKFSFINRMYEALHNLGYNGSDELAHKLAINKTNKVCKFRVNKINKTYNNIVQEYENDYNESNRFFRRQSNCSLLLLNKLKLTSDSKKSNYTSQINEAYEKHQAIENFIKNEVKTRYFSFFGLFKIQRSHTRLYKAIEKIEPGLVHNIESRLA